MSALPALVGQVRARLAAWEHRETELPAGHRSAAVAVVLLDHRDEPHVLVIKRVPRGVNPGQWALPGGRVEPRETSRDAVLREVAEETGLVVAQPDVLGRLDDIATGSGHVITPWVLAAAPGARPRRNPAEVASLHPVPVRRLLAEGVPRWRRTPTGPLLQMPLRHDMVVHAPTGAILWQFAQVCLRGQDQRLDGVAEPAFVSH